MINLLKVNIDRLIKNKLFIIFIIFVLGLSAVLIYNNYSYMKKYESGEDRNVHQLILNYSQISGFIAAIFSCLYLGSEYSEGGIRNKVITGHKRTKIYLSNLIIIAGFNIILYLLFVGISLAVGTPLLSKADAVIKEFPKYLVYIFLLIIAYSSIITFLGMTISNSTVVVLTIMIVTVGSFVFGFYSHSKAEKIKNPYYVYQNDSGEIITEAMDSDYNRYPGDFLVNLYDKLLKINPLGQALTMCQDAVTIYSGVEPYQVYGSFTTKDIDMSKFPIYSIADVIVFTALGLIIFNKKELK